MRYLLWIIKLLLFIVVLTFAVKNTDPVTVRYYLGTEWQAPLILVLLIAFCAGAAVGLITALGRVFRQRREIGGLKRELKSRPPQQPEPAPPAGRQGVNPMPPARS
jgi:uncharacterized integral membrane protein